VSLISSKKDWTILVYQGGVNDLSPSLRKNLNELAQGPHPDNVDVLVRQLDRSGSLTDFQIDGRGMTPLGPALPAPDSSDPQTLADFLRRGIQQYPARHYMLVVSSHGQGAGGVIQDERTGNFMQPQQFQQALEAGREANQGKPLDLVFFDACRMMAVEMASQIKGSVQVAVGSLDRIDSTGYDPGLWVQGAAASSDGLALGRLLTENRDPRQMEGLGTMAAVNLEFVEPLERALKQLAEHLAKLDPDQASRVREIATFSRRSLPSPSYQYALDNMASSILQGSGEPISGWLEEVRPTDPVAISSLCRNLLADPDLDQGLHTAAQAVIEAHAKAVFAQREECDGLSVVLPLERSSQVTSELAFESATQWQRAVDRLVPMHSPARLGKSWLEEELEARKSPAEPPKEA